LTVLFPAIVLFSACEKKAFDYRNKYIGEWNFEVERRSYHMDTTGDHYWDTINYQGRIDYGAGGNELLVQYLADDNITISIDKDGNVASPCYHCNASFPDKKTLDMYLRWGGLGEGYVHNVLGKKK